MAGKEGRDSVFIFFCTWTWRGMKKEQGNLEFGWLVGGRYTQYYHLLIIGAGVRQAKLS